MAELVWVIDFFSHFTHFLWFIFLPILSGTWFGLDDKDDNDPLIRNRHGLDKTSTKYYHLYHDTWTGNWPICPSTNRLSWFNPQFLWSSKACIPLNYLVCDLEIICPSTHSFALSNPQFWCHHQRCMFKGGIQIIKMEI